MNILHLDEYSVKTKVVSDRVLESCFVLVEERVSLQDPLIDLSQLQHVMRGTKHRNRIGKKRFGLRLVVKYSPQISPKIKKMIHGDPHRVRLYRRLYSVQSLLSNFFIHPCFPTVEDKFYLNQTSL